MSHSQNPARLRKEVYSFHTAQDFLQRYGRKNRDGDLKAKIANNTWVISSRFGAAPDNPEISVVLHTTRIVTYRLNGAIVLNSGGHRTTTTKARMNSLLPPPFHIHQRQYDWYVRTVEGEEPFEDLMVLYPRGSEGHDVRRIRQHRKGERGGYENPAHRSPRRQRKPPQGEIGSVSQGTLLTYDLLSSFSDALKEVYQGHQQPVSVRKLLHEVDDLLDQDEDDINDNNEEAGFVVEDLMETLEEVGPPWTYFGAHEGDGSDFGWWPSFDALDDAVRGGEVLKVEDLSEIPDNYNGEVMEVNDHGNVIMYVVRNGTATELWGVV